MKINDFTDAVKTKPNKANFKRDLAWLKMDLAMPQNSKLSSRSGIDQMRKLERSESPDFEA